MNGARARMRLPQWAGPVRAGRPSSTAWPADLAVGCGLFGLLYVVVLLATAQPGHTIQPAISLHYAALPLYTAYSVARMLAAYVLSLAFSLAYGYLAAYNRHAERILVPLLDILQSIPILSFLPTVVLALTGLFPHSSVGVELASILLVFTSQAWNLTYSFYNSLCTVPRELREVAAMYGLSWWQRFRQLELPSAVGGLVWNSMMSWAGGWFFLMAAEMFTLGDRSFQVPGLGSYLSAAASSGDRRAALAGIGALVLVIVALDQLVWRPAIAWADRFKLEILSNQNPPRSAVLILLRRSRLIDWLTARVLAPAIERLDQGLSRPPARGLTRLQPGLARRAGTVVAGALLLAALAYGVWRGIGLIVATPAADLRQLPLAALLTTLRVLAALLLSLIWTVPVGVTIGWSRVWADRLQPVVQILSSIPASAVFPIIVVAAGGRLGWLSILLMLLGTQWYVLFNVIAGAMALPADLREATALFGLGRWQRWRTLILPGIFPHLITGLLTAAGGAWNAAIITEYVQAGRHTYSTVGLGALIAQASQGGRYGLLLVSTLTLSLIVVLVNRFVWRRLHRMAEARYALMS